MPIIGAKELTQLPSMWAEARATGTLHNDNKNVSYSNHVINRADVSSMSHSSQYNDSSRGVYTSNSNPVVINRVA